MPSTLHQCLVYWIGDDVEVAAADDPVCVATADAMGESEDGCMACLSGKDLSEYNYISVSRDGLVPVNVKLMNVTRLNHIGEQ
jgi:hypothetical protein